MLPGWFTSSAGRGGTSVRIKRAPTKRWRGEGDYPDSLDESLLVCQGYKYLKMENSDHHVESLA